MFFVTAADCQRLKNVWWTAQRLLWVPLIAVLLSGCHGKVIEDEAKKCGLSSTDFPQITANIFRPMDGGIELAPEEIMGRNTWNLWSAGDQRFWDHVAHDTGGLVDLLQMMDNSKYRRDHRFTSLERLKEHDF